MEDHKIITFDQFESNGSQLGFKINTTSNELQLIYDRLLAEAEKADASFDILRDCCIDLIRRLPLPIYYLHDMTVLRARENLDGEVFNHISHISYNPFPDRITLGRFNLAGEAVFYGVPNLEAEKTENYATAWMESCKDFENFSRSRVKYFTVGQWKIERPLPVVLLTFYQPAEANSNQVRLINSIIAGHLQPATASDDYRKCKKFYEYFSMHASKRIESDNYYLLTTAFFHAVRQHYGSHVGIVYSSFMSRNFGLNVAISTDVVNALQITLLEVAMFKAQVLSYEKRDLDVFACSNAAIPDVEGKFGFHTIW
jgi:hypothetical protein